MIGQVILHYRIVAPLGTGGMGTVYVAEDLRLGRQVALKVLPPDFSSHPERLERFQREARALAVLNHPNIITVYSVEQAGEHHFITMELVRGQTLGRMIEGGLPLLKVLELGIQITDALARAHAQGVVHRDLKPSNVMIDEDGRVKVIDFGLAKLRDGAGSAVDAEAPTVPLTMAGRILGTPAYMSPEQLNGAAVDRRTDLFSLGILLFEMCTGRRPFPGDSAMAIASSILKDPPEDLRTQRPDLPVALSRLVAKCLQKNPELRVQEAAAVRDELKDILSLFVTGGVTGSRVSMAPVRGPGPWLGWIAVGAVGIATVVGVMLWKSGGGKGEVGRSTEKPRATGTTAAQAPVIRFVAPESWSSELATEEWPAISPDGTRVVYSQTVGKFQKLFVRDMARTQPAVQLTTGDNDDIQPTWAPDGQSLAFVRANKKTGKIKPGDVYGGFYYFEGDIWILDLKERSERRIVEEAFNPSINRNGVIAYHAMVSGASRIWTCDMQGRENRPLTEDSDKAHHMEPSWSPDGRRIVFMRQDQKYSARLAVVDVKTRVIRDLTQNLYASEPKWSPAGNCIVFSANLSSGFNLWRLRVNADGTLAGTFEPLTVGAGRDIHPSFTPDGKTLAYTSIGWNSDIWCMPLDAKAGRLGGPPQPLITSTREDTRASFSADEKFIAFTSDRDGEMNLWVTEFDSTTGSAGAPWRITSGPGGDYQVQWMPKGDAVVFFSKRAGNEDIWVQRLDERRHAVGNPVQLTTHPDRDVNPFPSPDGKHIAFQTDRSGANELWIMNPDGTGQTNVTKLPGGGHYSTWFDAESIIWTGHRVFIDGRPHQTIMGIGGAHMSMSPDRKFLIENDHTAIYMGPVSTQTVFSSLSNVFQFAEANVGVDYTVWSPSGKWGLTDRNTPVGGDIYLLRNID